jgi:hypothetical protein
MPDSDSNNSQVGSPGIFERLVFGLANVIGLLIYVPVLLALLMSFDSPGSGKHWVHWLFVASNLLLGPLCLIGLFSVKRRFWGVVGYGLAFTSWMLLGMVCGGKFTC